jgi:Metal-independent alpha-mannosidase (GH125)
VLSGFDDPNMPSLLGLPLLGYKHYDPQVCCATISNSKVMPHRSIHLLHLLTPCRLCGYILPWAVQTNHLLQQGQAMAATLDTVHVQIYANTRATILDAASNKLYYRSEACAADCVRALSPALQTFADCHGTPASGDKMEGLGSTHTPRGHVWPLAMMVEGLTSPSAATRIALLRRLLQLQVSPCALLASHAAS